MDVLATSVIQKISKEPNVQIGKEKIKLPQLGNDMTVSKENPKECETLHNTKNLLELLSKFSRYLRNKVNTC